MGQVCAKHDQFYETVCPWCEPEEDAGIAIDLSGAQNPWVDCQSVGYFGALTTGSPTILDRLAAAKAAKAKP